VVGATAGGFGPGERKSESYEVAHGLSLSQLL
jgi:hypothetical protein